MPEIIWKNPIIKKGALLLPGSECTPFVFNEKLYRLENWPACAAHYPKSCFGENYHDDKICIRDVETNTIIATPLRDHYFGIAFVHNNRCYVYAGRHSTEFPFWNIKEVSLTWSDNLVDWSEPETVLRSENGESIFNFGVCRDLHGGFVLLYETNDAQWPPFTFKYCRSDNLRDWRVVPGAVYGHDKYVGGPALYQEGDWFYTLYLESLGDHHYETRITRSRDLLHWEDAPAGRPFLSFDPDRDMDPVHYPGVRESNASDAECCYFNGKTIIYFNGGNQGEISPGADLQVAEFDGTLRELFEYFFIGVS